MICHEAGIALDLPYNPLASLIARQPIVGNVIILLAPSTRWGD